MKHYKTDTDPGVSPEFLERFVGAYGKHVKAPPAYGDIGGMVGGGARWAKALHLWKMVKEGTMHPAAKKGCRRDYAKFFEFLDKTGGQIPQEFR